MKSSVKYLQGAYLLMIIVIFTLPFFSVDSYTILKNTSSHLAAQNEPYAWIMNITFVCLGLASIVSGWNFYKRFWFHRIILVVFGISLVFAAYYQHGPIDTGVKYDINEDKLHSLFSNITGFTFVLLAISTAFILKQKKEKLLAFTIGISATLLSILMVKVADLMGFWQRIIFISSFGWMIYLFRTRKTNIKDLHKAKK